MKNNELKSGVAGIPSVFFALVLALGAGFTLAGCEQQGPLEEAGESIDDAVEGAGDSIEDATDRG